MPNFPALALSAVVLCGCGARDDTASLKSLAQGLQEAWPPPTRQLRMTMSVSREQEREVLHCRLTNTSREALEVDSSYLPCKTPQSFSFSVVSTAGRVHLLANPVVVENVGPPMWVSIAPDVTLQGDVDLQYVPLDLPRDLDLLLLWSHSVALNRGAEHVMVSGVTFLPRRSRQ